MTGEPDRPPVAQSAVGDAPRLGVSNGGAAPLLTVRGVVKNFGEVRAVDGVDFDVFGSHVLALLGQNGAGKSTLGKIIAGLIAPDHGSIMFEGRELRSMHSVERSRAVAIVQQELSIVSTATVAENVFLGSRRRGLWRRTGLSRDALPYLARVGLDDLDPERQASTLSVAEAQLVEIARVLARDARVIVFDEPTASLTDTEIERVEAIVRTLAGEGRGIIYVTHRLAEVMRFCHSALILRNGAPVARVDTDTTPLAEIVSHMLGRPLESLFPPRSTGAGGRPVLSAQSVAAARLAAPIDITLRAGEITGFASQLGAGAETVLRLLGGFERPASGSLMLDGTPVRLRSPAQAVDAGIVSCSDDRKRDGLFHSRTVSENLTSLSLRTLSRGPWIVTGRERALARRAAGFLGIDQSRLGAPVSTLSGGNQQKVVLGKLACRDPVPRVLLLNEPTRGVDVGARAEIYRLIRELADEGMAVAFASSDVTEVLGLADTVVTFFRGRIVRSAAAGGLAERQVVLDVTHPQSDDGR